MDAAARLPRRLQADRRQAGTPIPHQGRRRAVQARAAIAATRREELTQGQVHISTPSTGTASSLRPAKHARCARGRSPAAPRRLRQGDCGPVHHVDGTYCSCLMLAASRGPRDRDHRGMARGEDCTVAAEFSNWRRAMRHLHAGLLVAASRCSKQPRPDRTEVRSAGGNLALHGYDKSCRRDGNAAVIEGCDERLNRLDSRQQVSAGTIARRRARLPACRHAADNVMGHDLGQDFLRSPHDQAAHPRIDTSGRGLPG